MKDVKTATFRYGRYFIEQMGSPLDGLCDIPNSYSRLRMYIPDGDDLPSLHTIIHESCHASGVKDELLDGEGRDISGDIARLLWRLGWRRTL